LLRHTSTERQPDDVRPLDLERVERAEHIMLVDLGRNDLGRVCRFGTVRVTDLMRIEKYSHVMHIVSSIEGRLRAGLDCLHGRSFCFISLPLPLRFAFREALVLLPESTGRIHSVSAEVPGYCLPGRSCGVVGTFQSTP
jgi:hypothetical protein